MDDHALGGRPAVDDHALLARAIALGDRCPPSTTFRVGAVITDADGTVLATGHSGETDPHDHAEEAALAKLTVGLPDTALSSPVPDSTLPSTVPDTAVPSTVPDTALPGRLSNATMYTSLEPCSTRRSRPKTCTTLILESGIRRVVFAWREPAVFVDCVGAETLAAAGVTVIEIPALAPAVRATNAHLL